MPLLDPEVSAKLGTLQSPDDAIAYRQGRLQEPCQECEADGRCPEHRRDEHLIATYQDRQAAALQDALTGMDPGDIAVVMRPGDDLPPAVAAFSVAMLGQLRALAADGPAVVELDNGPAIIELVRQSPMVS